MWVGYLQVTVHASLIGMTVDVLQQCSTHPLVSVSFACPDQEDMDEAAMHLRHRLQHCMRGLKKENVFACKL